MTKEGRRVIMFYLPSSPFKWLTPSENTLLLILAVVVGLATAIFIHLFRIGIDFFHTVFIETIALTWFGQIFVTFNLPAELGIVLALALAGFIVGLLIHHFVGEEKYYGVAGIIESVALSGGRLQYMRVPAKILASMMSLGAGASVGAEDPSVQIGSNVGSFLGQKLHMSEERVRLLVSAGAASASAAAFNAPIAGVFFALEVILGEFSTRSFGTVVLASVISAAYSQEIANATTLFDGLSMGFSTPLQLPFYVLLGLVLALFSSFGLRLFYAIEQRWHSFSVEYAPLRTAITGAMIGIIGLFLPQIMGGGEGFMKSVLAGDVSLDIGLLILIGFAKLVATALSIGGGFVGGVFAPSLFMGIVFGSAYGGFLDTIFPIDVIGLPQAYAIAGMAGLIAGIVRAPITAVMLVFEVTDDYTFILPIMLTAVVCTFVIEVIGPEGIYKLALTRNGVNLQYGRDVDIMQSVTAKEAMLTPAPTINEWEHLQSLRDTFHLHHTRALCVLDDKQRLVGIVTLGDLQRAFETAMMDETITADEICVSDICTRDVVTTTPEETLWRVTRTMGARDIGRMPVIEPASLEVLGMLRRQDIMNAYNIAVTEKMHTHITAEQIRLNNLTGAHVLEYHIVKNHVIANICICDVRWPPEAVVASIKRNGRLIVPHGNTRLYAGDTLTIVADTDSEHILDHMFDRNNLKSDVNPIH